MSNRANDFSPNKQALLKIRELKKQLATAHRSLKGEPIAIVSMACRFPKTSDTPEKFWQSLLDQENLVSDIPTERWDLDAFYDEDPDFPGKMYAKRGAFLDQIDQIDPEFFGISPREATWVDPQQRLLMEVGWEAIERAGWVPNEIGEQTGVFVGWMHNDYQNEASDSFLNLNPYIATGAAGSFLCGRLAHYLGLQGPSIAIDTACSSSLVALHLAIQSLQRGDCERALVGGVNAICSPTTNILTCKLKALSPSGHSKAFDAAADGYLRGEGCGVVTLRRLSQAQKDADPILGIIKGSAIGHNGSGGGLTVPNPKAQEKVIRDALATAQIKPEEVLYLEAHGTGTELGDPIELSAAAAALTGMRTPDNPLLVGSVKTNIGHLEAAAGMAGLIKVILAMQNNRLPGQMNFETPNPHIPWAQIPIKVLTGATDWPNADRKIAGVSAFGMSGTNAHVIVEAPQHQSITERRSSPTTEVITLSAKSQEALLELADLYAERLAHSPEMGLEDVAFTSNTARRHFEFRAAIVAANCEEAASKLATVARGSNRVDTFVGHTRHTPRVAWQFTGQGSQFVTMGKRLYDNEPLFRDVIDQCDAELKSLRSGSLRDAIFDDSSGSPDLNSTDWTQPAIFSLQRGLVALLSSWGLEPDLVLGHSVGQYAAACAAGIMSWPDGLRLIAERGRIIGDLPLGGKMLAVFAPLLRVNQVIAEHRDVALAANNGTHVVVSGAELALRQVNAVFESEGIRTKELTTSHAFHSQLMDPALKPFEKIASQFQFEAPQIPLVCNVSATVLAANETLDAGYWSSHIRKPVRYIESIKAVDDAGCDMILELGPQAVLTKMAAAAWDKPAGSLISCLQKDTDDLHSIKLAVAAAYAFGVTPNFKALHKNSRGKRILLPTYPFQRRRFWGPDKPRAFHAEYHTAHPLLGSQIDIAGVDNEKRFQSFIDADSPSWMPDHQVMSSTVMPGAGFIEIAIELAENLQITNLSFEQPLVPNGRTALQTVLRSPDSKHVETQAKDRSQRIEVYSRATDIKEWTRHFSATLEQPTAAELEKVDRDEIRSRCNESEQPATFYSRLNSLGLSYGPSFQVIRELYFSETEVLAKLQVQGDVRGYNIPPTMIDGALHCLAAGILKSDDQHLFLPVSIGSVDRLGPVADEIWCTTQWQKIEETTRTADITLFNNEGQVIVRMLDLKVQRVSLSALRQINGTVAKRLAYELTWKLDRLPEPTVRDRNFLIVHSANRSDSGLTNDLAACLTKTGNDVINIEVGASSFRQASDSSYQLNGETKQQWIEFLSQNQKPIHGVCWLIDTLSPEAAREQVCWILSFVQSLLDQGIRKLECGIQLVTTNAIALNLETDKLVNPNATLFWGLGRALGAEQPELKCRLVDVSGDDTQEGIATQVAGIMLTPTDDNQLVVRGHQVFVPRLKSTRLSKNGNPFTANPNGCYLVTGGLGQLGRQVADWLAKKGAQQIVLVSRRQPDEATQLRLESEGEMGCQMIVHTADVSQRLDLERLFARFGSDLNPLSGVIHAAGVLDDGLIESQTWNRFERVLAPKMDAAAILHELTQPLELDLFVIYSSAASILGSPGQSNYATGNAYLDGLAWHRKQSGLPCLSINWGPWSAGMADDEKILKRMALQGIRPLTSEQAHSAMEQLLHLAPTQALVMDVDWQRMRIGPGGGPPNIAADLVGQKPKSSSVESALLKQLKQMTGSARRDLVVTTIQNSLQQILSTQDAPETDRPLIEMGLDSLMAVEFSTALQQMLGDQIPVGPTMLFDYPSIDAISDHVLELISNEPVTQDNSKSEAEVAPTSKVNELIREDIAIIGMSCRFPGAENIHEFWQNLLNGVDSVCDIPNDRWDVEKFYDSTRKPGTMYTRSGGFLDDIADFDAEFFSISDQEACWIDPQHRLLLENSYRALEDAGIATQPLADPNVGVFMGIMGQDYAFLPTLDDEDVIRGFQGAGLSHSAGVGRISYLFGFEGPSVAVDTASSSSLVAVYQAMRSLQEGNCNLALAGGVNAILAPVNSLLMSKAGLLSPDGRCKSFSAEADGFGRGEGCGVLILKRLSDAQQNGDRIMAVIKGGAVVHNGFTGGITSPSSKAQARVIDTAIKDAGIAPSQVQYLEAHGTGTEFGDPMELGAAASIYGKGRQPEHPLLIGSVKANISHLEAAGGASGLIKTVLSIHHGVIPQQIHCEQPSPHIPWQQLPLKIATENTPWPECERQMAGVTALGLVGTNAHLVVGSDDSNQPTRSTRQVREPQLFVFSAKTESALRAMAANYLKFLRSSQSIHLGDLCYTTSAGRRHYEYRAAIELSSREELLRELAEFELPNVNQPARNGSPNHRVHFSTKPKTSAGVAACNPKLAWIFPDEVLDSSSIRILRELSISQPVVKKFIDQLDQRLVDHGLNWSINQLLKTDTWTSAQSSILYFVLQASLAKLALSWGLEADAALGFGNGQYVAASVAGCLCFLDASVLVVERELKLESGDEDWEDFEAIADQFNFYPPNLQLVCSIKNEIVPVHRSLGGKYWRDHVTSTCDIEESLNVLGTLQCGQNLIFATPGNSQLDAKLNQPSISWLNKNGGAGGILTALAKLYVAGCNPDFKAVFAGSDHQPVSVPGYPFQRKRYWITEISRHMDERVVQEVQVAK